ncbi:hypothetical protein GF367_01685 [Candidatus Woesearchaeota archaeon]|nr:hypothetical protein [Candidatus Woesearchaeota archaeon]
MAVIPQGVENMVESVLSYLVLILTILFVLKLIQIFTSIGGFKFGSSGGGSGSGRDGSGSSSSPRDKKNRKEKEEDRSNKDKIDPDRKGQVKFLVVDQDDNPIPEATVMLKPAYASKRKYALAPSWLGQWAKNKDTWREYHFVTNADGFAPTRDKHAWVASGLYHPTIIKAGYKQVNLRGKNAKHEIKHIEIIPDEMQEITLTLIKKTREDDQAEPKVKDVKQQNDKLVLKGEII